MKTSNIQHRTFNFERTGHPHIIVLPLAVLLGTVSFIGCIGYPSNPAATQPVTISDPATTQPDYWFAAPSHGMVVYDHFATLYKTCENVCRDFGFKIDRVDYRIGLLTTEPLESAQIFEPWRPDVGSLEQTKESTICSLRRTIRFDIVRNADGTYQASPKVLVERQTVQERRITSVALYKGAYSKEAPRDLPKGSAELDEGFLIPQKYWYAIGRDTPLEVKLAHEVSARLARKGRDLSPVTQPSDEAE